MRSRCTGSDCPEAVDRVRRGKSLGQVNICKFKAGKRILQGGRGGRRKSRRGLDQEAMGRKAAREERGPLLWSERCYSHEVMGELSRSCTGSNGARRQRGMRRVEKQRGGNGGHSGEARLGMKGRAVSGEAYEIWSVAF